MTNVPKIFPINAAGSSSAWLLASKDASDHHFETNEGWSPIYCGCLLSDCGMAESHAQLMQIRHDVSCDIKTLTVVR
jgi:hypothetical protein